MKGNKTLKFLFKHINLWGTLLLFIAAAFFLIKEVSSAPEASPPFVAMDDRAQGEADAMHASALEYQSRTSNWIPELTSEKDNTKLVAYLEETIALLEADSLRFAATSNDESFQPEIRQAAELLVQGYTVALDQALRPLLACRRGESGEPPDYSVIVMGAQTDYVDRANHILGY